jgi:hypothetical protein
MGQKPGLSAAKERVNNALACLVAAQIFSF